MKISFKEAFNLCLENADQIANTENIFINEAIGRFLAEDIYAKKDYPYFTNSAMDGFAFKYSNNKKLKIVKTIYVGDDFEDFSIKEDECIKVMTGAKLPSCVDSVVPIEDCIVNNNEIIIKKVKKGANIRLKGEEVKKGELLVKKGEEITPEIIALLAREGIVNVKVYRKIKIAILSSGDEIKEPFECEEGIYNVNSYALKALFNKYNFEVSLIKSVKDDLQTLVEVIDSLKSYDVIISTGGISVGEKDYLYEAFLKNSLKVIFKTIALKPGHPAMAGKVGDSFVFSFGGNPLASFLNAFLLAIPTIRKIAGARKYYFNYVLAKNEEDFKVSKNKTHLVLGKLKEGKFRVYNKYKYGSNMLKPLLYSNSVAILQEVKEYLKVIPFSTDFVVKSDFFN